MARILITSGPTRQYLDPIRFLTNASSGHMGKALAEAALEQGNDVVIVSGPVVIDYPSSAELISVLSTEDMLEACLRIFPSCQGAIGVAAPCDYRPVQVRGQKINKTGQPLMLQLIETPDVVATLGSQKRVDQWIVGFALETNDRRFRAITKLERKSCDLMVLNGPQAISATSNHVEVIDPHGQVVLTASGAKENVARDVFQLIQRQLIDRVG